LGKSIPIAGRGRKQDSLRGLRDEARHTLKSIVPDPATLSKPWIVSLYIYFSFSFYIYMLTRGPWISYRGLRDDPKHREIYKSLG
jgi:hypothetical protein